MMTLQRPANHWSVFVHLGPRPGALGVNYDLGTKIVVWKYGNHDMILIEKCYSCHLKKVRENVTGRNYKIYITLPPVTSILVYYYRTVDQRKYL